MSGNPIHAPGVGVPIQAVAYGDLGEDARPVTAAAPLPTYAPRGLVTVSAAFSRPADATAYAVGDLVADAGASASVVPLELVGATRGTAEAIRIERVRLRKSGTGLTHAAFRVHLFSTAPVVTVGDNGVFNAAGTLALAGIEGHAGYLDVVMDLAAGDGAGGIGLPGAGSGMTCEARGGVGHETCLWALIEARGAYVPVAGETFVLTLEGARS